MKPKEKAFTWSAASPARLYLDDIEKLHNILLKVADEVEYELPDYEDVQHANELTQLDGVFRQLEMRAHKVYGAERQEDLVRVQLFPDKIKIIAAQDTPELRGVRDELRDVIQIGRAHV